MKTDGVIQKVPQGNRIGPTDETTEQQKKLRLWRVQRADIKESQ